VKLISTYPEGHPTGDLKRRRSRKKLADLLWLILSSMYKKKEKKKAR